MKRHHDHGKSYKGEHLIGTGLQFKGVVHYCHVKKHGGIQTDMVLEKLKALHPELQEGRKRATGPGLGFRNPKPTPKGHITPTEYLPVLSNSTTL